jgi:hypothetical protein
MEAITRNVRDIGTADRRALEHVIGRSLADGQRLLISVLDVEMSSPESAAAEHAYAALPDWCNVYHGLTDDAVTQLEEVILTRADLNRATE